MDYGKESKENKGFETVGTKTEWTISVNMSLELGNYEFKVESTYWAVWISPAVSSCG